MIKPTGLEVFHKSDCLTLLRGLRMKPNFARSTTASIFCLFKTEQTVHIRSQLVLPACLLGLLSCGPVGQNTPLNMDTSWCHVALGPIAMSACTFNIQHSYIIQQTYNHKTKKYLMVQPLCLLPHISSGSVGHSYSTSYCTSKDMVQYHSHKAPLLLP